MRLNLKYIVQTARCIVQSARCIVQSAQRTVNYKPKTINSPLGGLGGFLLLLFLLASCSDENLLTEDIDHNQTTDPELYLSLNINLYNENYTRSTTLDNGESSDGRIDGTSKETDILSADLYFCVNNEIKAVIPVNQYIQKPNSSGATTLWTQIEDLTVFKDLAGAEEVQIMIVGNTADSGVSHDFGTETGNTDDASAAKITFTGLLADPIGDFGTEGKVMPLTNVKEFTTDKFKDIPQYSESNKKAYVDAFKKIFEKQTLSNLWWEVNSSDERIELERAVARIDWKDLDREMADNDNPNKELPKFIYKIGYTDVTAKIHSLQVFNVNKKSYLFRHTAAGTSTGANQAAELFGYENGGNGGYKWIAGSDWTFGTNSFTKTGDFWNPRNSLSGTNGLITISKLTEKTEDDEYVRPLQEGYHPWCYVSENTLPHTSMDEGQNATGIAFTFKIMNGDKPLTKEDVKNNNFEYSGAAEATSSTDGNVVRLTDSRNQWIEVIYTEGNDDEESGFFITYYASIVHNDDKDNSKTGPMEYAVVRNNVYEVTVKSLSNLPNPREPEGFSIVLQVQVLPWGLRVDDNIILK